MSEKKQINPFDFHNTEDAAGQRVLKKRVEETGHRVLKERAGDDPAGQSALKRR